MKYLHTMVRVKDLELSLEFYCEKLGMVELSRYDNEGGRFTLVFLAASEDAAAAKKIKHPLSSSLITGTQKTTLKAEILATWPIA
jgi:lactoylglutathione lyase